MHYAEGQHSHTRTHMHTHTHTHTYTHTHKHSLHCIIIKLGQLDRIQVVLGSPRLITNPGMTTSSYIDYTNITQYTDKNDTALTSSTAHCTELWSHYKFVAIRKVIYFYDTLLKLSQLAQHASPTRSQ